MKNIPEIPTDFQTFVEGISGDANAKVTFQTFGDKSKDQSLAKIIHGRPSDVYDQLHQWNEEGRGIFMMINKGDMKGRKAENVVNVRAVFADFDETPYDPDDITLTPHMVVESSPGKYHVYWLVSDLSMDRFKVIQKAIAARFNSDVSVHDICRVMRVPGFYHQKGDPFLTHIVERNDISRYSMQEIVNDLGLDLESVPLKTSKQKSSNFDSSTLDRFDFVDQDSGEIFDLVKWAKRHPDFLVADALRFHKPEVVLGPPRDDKQHIRCPFHEDHTDQGDDLATFCVNGTDPKKEHTGFVIHCLHAHCDGRDRLDYVRKMLERGWLPLEVLKDKKFLAERHRPPWLKYPTGGWDRSPGYKALKPDEQRVFLHLQEFCWSIGEGCLKDDDWTISRQLGLKEEDWLKLKEAFIRSGLLKVENGCLVNDHILDIYENSRQAYEAQVRSGREGGKSRSSS